MNQLKTIRSFVKRARQLGPKKQQMFIEMWPQYGLEITPNQISPKKIFGRDTQLTLEIGFGYGETIFSLAQKYPEQDFIGIEVHKPGITALLSLLKNHPLSNIRIYNGDAVAILHQCIPDEILDNILILFPDPWPKRRHHKRRLIQPKFIELLQKKLKSNGRLNIVTDWKDYAEHINKVLKNNSAFIKIDSSPTHHFPQERTIATKFEQRGKKLGHKNFELTYRK